MPKKSKSRVSVVKGHIKIKAKPKKYPKLKGEYRRDVLQAEAVERQQVKLEGQSAAHKNKRARGTVRTANKRHI